MIEDQSLMERAYRLEELEEARYEAGKYLTHRQALTKKYHDNGLRKEVLHEGDLVLMYDRRFAHFMGKLHTRLGPYVVYKVFPNGSIQVATLEGDVFPVRVHFDRLKKYYNQE